MDCGDWSPHLASLASPKCEAWLFPACPPTTYPWPRSRRDALRGKLPPRSSRIGPGNLASVLWFQAGLGAFCPVCWRWQWWPCLGSCTDALLRCNSGIALLHQPSCLWKLDVCFSWKDGLHISQDSSGHSLEALWTAGGGGRPVCRERLVCLCTEPSSRIFSPADGVRRHLECWCGF